MPTSLGRLNGQKDGQTESVKQHRALHAVVRQKGITNESINHILFAKNKIRYSCMYNYKYGRLSEKLWSSSSCSSIVTSCAGGRHNTPPPPASWPLTLKVVSESRVTWSTSVPILFFLGLSVLDLGQMYATDRRQTSDAHRRLMPLPSGGSIITWMHTVQSEIIMQITYMQPIAGSPRWQFHRVWLYPVPVMSVSRTDLRL